MAAAPAGSTHQILIDKNEYQLKLVTFINEGVDHLRAILHDPTRGNKPSDGTKLYQALLPYKKILSYLKRDQLEIVFPQSQQTDSKLFDITLLCSILINCCPNIQAPNGGWKIKEPQSNDISEGADIIRIRNARNDVMHGTALNVTEYNDLWNNIESALRRLGYDVTKVVDLKTGSLEDLELFKVEITKAKVEILSLNVTQNQNDIKQNQIGIKDNQKNVKQNHININKNQGDILQNRVDIEENQLDIEDNKAGIEQNQFKVKENKVDIENIRYYIEQNRYNVEQNQVEIEENQYNMKENQFSIEENRDDIEQSHLAIEENLNYIEQNQFKIEENKVDIKENQDDIKQSRLELRECQDEIGLNQVEIKENQTVISECREDIKQNEVSIKQNKNDIKCIQENVKRLEDSLTSHSPIRETTQLEHTQKKQPSFLLFKNRQDNLVIQFEDDCLSIQCVYVKDFVGQTNQLHRNDDYIVEKRKARLILIVYNHEDSICDLQILVMDDKLEIRCVVIEDIAVTCAHECVTNHLDVISHNSDTVFKQIESIVNTTTVETALKFICGGKLQRKTPEEYKEFAKDYKERFFTLNDGHVEDALQFPPPMLKQACSLLAQKIKNVMSRSKHRLLTIFTHYNSKEHIKFKKLDKECSWSLEMAPGGTNKILLLYSNSFINIRYTEAIDALTIQHEFGAGEKDLKELAILNKKYLRNGNTAFYNVVAAPNFEDFEDLCIDCKLLDKKTLSVDRNIRSFFGNLLQRSQTKNISCNNKEEYKNIISDIMCFMATRKALYGVPSLSDDIHEQISSLTLTTQQLHILHDSSNKKIITGPLGSGKTVLALSHLELVYENSETKSVIYYVIWDDKTLLKQDVITYATKFNYKENVTVLVKDIVELAKHLKMSKVPTLSMLMVSLLNKHAGEMLHLIIDELNGEIFDMEESLSLKQYFENETKWRNSVVVLFPQTIEKHREFVSGLTVTKHDRYKYEETGMKLYKLNKVMRTSKSIFQFLRAFENEITKFKSLIRHPVQQNESKNDSGDTEEHTEISQNLEQHQQEQHEVVLKKIRLKKEKKEAFELPFDIDVVAAAINDEDDSKVSRTDLKVECNSADSIGHNIEGTKPKILHLTAEEVSEDESIVILALALEEICLAKDTKRLFIYNTLRQMHILHKLLILLDMDYFCYDESTDWKILENNNTIAETPLQRVSYNILTTQEGSRGIEAAECICIIDIYDCNLKHLTLEGMSRATQELLLVSTCSITQSNMPISSTGQIIRELLSEYLIENRLTRVASPNPEEQCTVDPVSEDKIILNVNSLSWRYKEMMKAIECIDGSQAPSTATNVHEIVLKNLYPPKRVNNVKCAYLSNTTCEVSWRNEGYIYTVKKQENNSSVWKNIARNITSAKYKMEDVIIDENYKFCVVASNQVGQSDHSIVSYCHRPLFAEGEEDDEDENITFEDIEELIFSDDIREMNHLLASHPKIVIMRDNFERTPLMSMVRRSDNTAMVELLIGFGSDVWAEDAGKSNSYHLASWSSHHKVLKMLCMYDSSNINRGDLEDRTPLHWAALCGSLQCVDVLLRLHNVDTTIRDADGRTASDVAGMWRNKHNRQKIRKMITEYEEAKK